MRQGRPMTGPPFPGSTARRNFANVSRPPHFGRVRPRHRHLLKGGNCRLDFIQLPAKAGNYGVKFDLVQQIVPCRKASLCLIHGTHP